MESDDDYQSFSPLEESSPAPRSRKLKRLKKTAVVSDDPIVNSSAEDLSAPLFDSSNFDDYKSTESRGLEEDLKSGPLFDSSNFDDDNLESTESRGLEEDLRSGLLFDSSNFDDGNLKCSEPQGVEEDLNEPFGSDSIIADAENEISNGVENPRAGVKRFLEFDDEKAELGEEIAESEQKERGSETSGEKKEKKKTRRVKSEFVEEKPKATVSNKRKEEKERKEYLKHLHAESQRLLRETRNAAFKPVPIVQKPISSILEKIKQRKQELLKKTASYKTPSYESDDSLKDNLMSHDSENSPVAAKAGDEILKVANEEAIMQSSEVGRSLGAADTYESTESAEDLSLEHNLSPVALDDESKHSFRAPIDDTEDLYCDSESNDSGDVQPSMQDDSPVEEPFAPSLLAMNLKFDSAPPDEASSDDEEDDDKENIKPARPEFNFSSHANGGPVKAFLDEEAVEEDDSDNDLSRFKDEEDDDDIEDAEELKDMIASEYKEKPIDDEMRQNLHMKWLEQQDAFGTDKLLQKYGHGSTFGETTLLDNEDDREEGEEDFSDDDTEDVLPRNVARLNAKKIKQMIPQMFIDKDDVYVSSDDEEVEKILVKQRVLKKAEDKSTFLSALEDDKSREVFGLIKKLNIVPDTKRKAKASSSFDMMCIKKSNNPSKSSFLGRMSNSSLSTSHKRASSTMRSYIFGRDDCNSRTSMLISEDSSDTIEKEVRSTKTYSAKFSNSHSKSASQKTQTTTEVTSSTSLFEILRRSSLQTDFSDQKNVVQTQSIFAAFKLSKNPIKRV